MITKKNILFCVLNWGLGHASRSIPLIHKYIQEGHKVIIASDGESKLLLEMEFPLLKSYTLPSYNVHYKYSMLLNMITQGVKIQKVRLAEKKSVSMMVETEEIDMIISDNRFGCYHPNIDSTIITHQVTLKHNNKLVEKLGSKINQYFINQFNQCWIPDEKNGLSGILSEGELNIPKKYIGTQSTVQDDSLEEDIDVLFLLSGPEPTRSQLESAIRSVIPQIRAKKVVIVRGTNKESTSSIILDEEYDLVDRRNVNELLNRSKIVVCRSGYSTLMDLDKLRKKVILIPTPGQTEQEYLAAYLSNRYNFVSIAQNNIEVELSKVLA